MPIILGSLGPIQPQEFSIFTKSLSFIESEQPMEVDNRILRERKRLLTSMFRDCEFRSVSNTYNCVGLVFASRRAFIDTDQLGLILNDDGYIEIPKDDAMEGDVITYENEISPGISHVGFVQKIVPSVGSKEIFVLSKWGNDVEMLHKISRVPEVYGTKVKFWTERKNS